MKKKTASLSVIGCGWFGLALAKEAIKNGLLVKGSTTTPEKISELNSAGIDTFLARFPSDLPPEIDLFNAKVLVINLPPGRRNPNALNDYPLAIKQIIEYAKKWDKITSIIFISSTSVYGNDEDLIDEDTIIDPQSASGKAIEKAEEMIKSSNLDYQILRFGGLAGPGRHPGRFLAGRSGLSTGSQSINFLHLDDAVGAVMHLLNMDCNSGIYNIVSPLHPTKKEFYVKMSDDLGLEPPSFEPTINSFKREISVSKFLEDTGYEFVFPDPLMYRF